MRNELDQATFHCRQAVMGGAGEDCSRGRPSLPQRCLDGRRVIVTEGLTLSQVHLTATKQKTTIVKTTTITSGNAFSLFGIANMRSIYIVLFSPCKARQRERALSFGTGD